MRLLDLFCGEGGAALGYTQAGFDVTGVDHNPATRRYYPYRFILADALAYLLAHGHEYDVIHASPPCQKYTAGTRASDKRYPDLVAATRRFLTQTGKPYIIENVDGAPLHHPITLCGSMFNLLALDQGDDHATVLHLQRHRLFESNLPLRPPRACVHRNVQWAGSYAGARNNPDEARHIRKGGYVPTSDKQAQLMGVDWHGTTKGLHQAIPPAYTHWLGTLILDHLGATP